MKNSIKIITGVMLVICTGTFFGCNGKKRSTSKQKVNTQVVNVPALPAFFDVRPCATRVSYIYAPGITATETMMGRYCPSFTAITGEKLTWTTGGHVIGQPHSAVAFPEIDLNKPRNSFTINPITAFMNNIRKDLSPVGVRFFQDTYGFKVEDNPQSLQSVVGYSLKLGKANIAQHKDIDAFRREYNKHVEKYPHTDIVLYGDSRGAATIFNVLAQYQLPQVKAAVLEGCFDTIPHCIKHFLYTDKGKRAEKRLNRLLSLTAGSYKKKGPFPRDYAEKINDEIPLLFVTSLKDRTVASQCTFRLYKRLKERGHQKVHLLVLKKSAHSTYMLGDETDEDKKVYEAVVHAFYQMYGLPHNSIKAAEGKLVFELSQPSIEELTRLYALPLCPEC